jgi:hypothetical protein
MQSLLHVGHSNLIWSFDHSVSMLHLTSFILESTVLVHAHTCEICGSHSGETLHTCPTPPRTAFFTMGSQPMKTQGNNQNSTSDLNCPHKLSPSSITDVSNMMDHYTKNLCPLKSTLLVAAFTLFSLTFVHLHCTHSFFKLSKETDCHS